MTAVEKLNSAGFVQAASALEELGLLEDNGGALKNSMSAAPTPAAATIAPDTTPVGAKMLGVSLLSPRGKFDVDFRDESIRLESKATGPIVCKLDKVQTIFELAMPNANPKIKCSLIAVVLSSPMPVGKNTVSYLVLQSKDTEKIEASINADACQALRSVCDADKMSGTPAAVFAKILCCLTDKQVFKHNPSSPNSFVSSSGGNAFKCNIKSVHDGYLFPMERGFFFVNKFVFIAKEDVVWVEFGRAGAVSTRTFDLIVMMKGDVKHEFSMIDKDEHTRLAAHVKRMKFKTKAEADAAASSSKTTTKTASEHGHDSTESTDKGAGAGQEAQRKPEQQQKQKQQQEQEQDEEDDSDEDDESFKCDESSDESEGYDAMEAMDVEKMAEDNDDDDSDDDDEDDDEEGEEEAKDSKAGDKGGSASKSHEASSRAPENQEANENGDDTEEDESERPSKRACTNST